VEAEGKPEPKKIAANGVRRGAAELPRMEALKNILRVHVGGAAELPRKGSPSCTSAEGLNSEITVILVL
jgi:hypothetical protein